MSAVPFLKVPINLACPGTNDLLYSILQTMGGSGIVIGPGTATIGAVTDAGGMTVSRGVEGQAFNSSDQSGSAVPITDAPGMGKSLVITDIILSADTTMEVTLTEETTGILLELIFLGANSTINLVTRGKFKLSTANIRLLLQTSVAGNISATVLYYSE